MRIMSDQLVARRQLPLRRRYQEAPEEAWIHDQARAVTGLASDPFHGEIEPANNHGARWAYGIHQAFGGDHDAPNPGDVLCAALAGCLHSTTRMVAQLLGMELDDIEVTVTAELDARGALRVDTTVPVGFQRMTCDVRVQPRSGVEDASLKTLMENAEACCVVMQTLRGGVAVQARWHFDRELEDV